MKQISNSPSKSLTSYRRFLDNVGVSRVCGWRWRKKGWLNPINIAGRLYLTTADIEQFESRASAGEFAQEPVTPTR